MKELVYHRMLLPQVEARADEVGFIDGAYRATFGQHIDRVGRAAQVLRNDLGVGRADRFAVMALNSHQYMELWHAAFLGAGVMNPLNLRLAPKELAYILENSGTKVVFTDFLFAGVIEQVREQAGIEQVVLIGEGDAPHDVSYEELVAAADSTLPDEPEEDDPVVLMYTGGHHRLAEGRAARPAGGAAQPLSRGDVVGPRRAHRQPQPDPHVPCRHHGWGVGRAGCGWHVGVRAALRPGERHGHHRGRGGHLDGDGADDDRSRPQPSRLPARTARLARGAHLWRLTHADRAARAPARDVPRPAHLPGLRDDRGERSAHRARARRAPHRWVAAEVGRPGGARRIPEHPGSRRPGGAPWRDRRSVRAGRQLHAGVLEQPRGHRGGVPRRLVPHRATPATSTSGATSTSSTG